MSVSNSHERLSQRGWFGRSAPIAPAEVIKKLLAMAVYALLGLLVVNAWREESRVDAASADLAATASMPSRHRLAPGDSAAPERTRDDPFDSAPFVDAALRAARRGLDGEAETLMRHAVRMDPRDSAARAWLFTNDLRGQHFADAISNAYTLYQLEPALEPTLSRTLAILAQLPDVRLGIIQRFRGTPYLGAIVSAAQTAGLGQQALLDLIAALSPSARADAQSALLTALIASKDYDGVAGALRRFGQASGSSGNLLFDDSFRILPGPSPFNWALTSDGDISATPVSTHDPRWPTALHVERFTAAAAIGARQSLLVSAGRYRLSLLIKAGNLSDQSGSSLPFAWVITCPGAPKPELLRLPFAASSADWEARSVMVDVPGSCPLIELALTSSFNDAAVRADAIVTRIRFEPLK